MRRCVQVHPRLTDAESEVPGFCGSRILELLEQYGAGPEGRPALTAPGPRALEGHYQISWV